LVPGCLPAFLYITFLINTSPVVFELLFY
jgi:hypothetical protein